MRARHALLMILLLTAEATVLVAPATAVDFGRGIRKLNPDVKIIGTAWSPPAWMKVNRSIAVLGDKAATRMPGQSVATYTATLH